MSSSGSSNNDSDAQILAQLKGKLWYHLEMILQDIESRENVGASTTTGHMHVTHSNKYINALVEVILTKLQEITTDLEQFAKHDTGRSIKQINIDDLSLYLRNSSQLQNEILPKKK
ncbi:similar to Saccharomyces cerevisiae YOL086W-A MHF1 Putative protein of unknown function [Maudiozyma saulgeensis]|uniref:MHF histone-fold complex subunit 1 n=1 Tax=Maudiozyma saulgeensis TaxID=1789683 RepID=A0A1X7R8T5_9SACH|nr:similar to Saccharomyces cerevisiae YOL086W-A MHF1 Putative protein of unknown function [Kazachstania saulgeensis]